MAERPLLIFPEPSRARRRLLEDGRVTRPRIPSPQEQSRRLQSKFSHLEHVFSRRQVELRDDPAGAEVEQVLVLETVGYVDNFINALRGIEGMEWMGESDVDDIVPDDNFYFEEDRQKPLTGRLYLIMFNLHGLQELLSLWQVYRTNPDDPRFGYGRMKWRDLFNLLVDIRPWGPQDRLYETGLFEVWQERLQAGAESVHVEIELWPRRKPEERQRAVRTVQHYVDSANGQLLGETFIDEINYHGVLARLPIRAVSELLSNENMRLVKCDQVMFFRPAGQAIAPLPAHEPLPGPDHVKEAPLPTGEPVVALLDGYPLENHRLLRGRIIVDDPDDWAADCPAAQRRHGTAMASLIIHGDLNAGEQPISRPLYVRPILKPAVGLPESIPDTALPIDLVHRAVRRMVAGDGNEPPVAPRVRIINLSVCDRRHVFDRYPTPWARLLDYLSWQYRLLFVVSAGNYPDDIELYVPRTEFDALRTDPEQLQQETLRAIARQARYRRLRSPADGVNVLSVGAVHEDSSSPTYLGQRVDPLPFAGLPSPINAQGPGFRRSVKPDILCPGGRQTYTEKLGTTHRQATLQASVGYAPPGQAVAAPGPLPGDVTKIAYTRGTSNAAALATRTAARLYELIEELRSEPGGDRLEEASTPVLIKALMVHSASWGDAPRIIEPVLDNQQPYWRKLALARLLGYGQVRPERVFECTAQRATLLGWGRLGDGEANIYRLPLPPSLSGKRTWRRLIVTLAWITPINPRHRAYRVASLWFDPYDADARRDDIQRLLGARRLEAYWKTVRNGTVQHEIFYGERATAFVQGDELAIQVNCRQEAGQLEDQVPYAIVVTLEVAEGIDVQVYDEIRARIRPAVRVRAGAE